MRWANMSSPPIVQTFPINLYINYIVTIVEVDCNAWTSVCSISHARGSLFARVSGPIHLDAQGG